MLNVTKFLEEHPGGEEVLIESSGKDATTEFEDIGHSNSAKKLLTKYQVGVLKGNTFRDVETDATARSREPRKKEMEMEAYVLKNNAPSKISAFLEFFVPLLVAGSYFAYRVVVTTADQMS